MNEENSSKNKNMTYRSKNKLKEDTEQASCYIPVSVKEEFKNCCEVRGNTISGVLREYVYQYIRNRNK